ncbi:MAG: hypothetical protein KH279_01505 [Collinsella intestinalis]|nr:hypothetical protein [Collinsella intestinalis]
MEMTPELMESFAAAMGGALAQGMAKHDDEKRERDEERKRAEGAARERERLAEIVAGIARADRERRARAVCRALDEARSKAYGDMLDELSRDAEMVKPINYVERYNALRSVGDSRVVAQKLELTLDQADALLKRASACNPAGALERAAAAYVKSAAGLAGIEVGEPDDDVSSELIDLQRSLGDGLVTASRELGDEMAQLVRGVFVECATPSSDAVVQAAERERARHLEDGERNRELVDAVRSAIDAALKAAVEDAEQVAGKQLAFELPDAYTCDVSLGDISSAEKLRELAREVRRSFATFKEVIADNGVFAAFAGTGSFGNCQGDFWFWDDECEYTGDRPGSRQLEGIECGVEEDQGGDSLERCIERMREFNAREYWGMLDDDFPQYVDAFWYGFEHYMRELGEICRVDMRSFKRYCTDVDGRVRNACWELALRMDDVQAREFARKFE